MTTLTAIALGQVTLVVACLAVLRCCLPKSIRKRIDENCSRPDGTRSPSRTQRETRALNNFTASMLLGSLMLLVAANGLLLIVHSVVIPIPLGIQAISSFHVDPNVWEQRLEAERIDQRYTQWYTADKGTKEQARSRQETLWTTWPVMLAAGIGLLAGGLAAFKSIYFAALRQLKADAEERSKEYRWRDLRYPKDVPSSH